jgi:hypothetical protein
MTAAEGAKIILESAAPAVKDDPSRQTLRGEVTAVKPDGTVQIQTDKGPVEITIPPESRGPRPQAGDRVEIDIPPASEESAPREVRVRITERAPAQEAGTPPPRTSETPVEVRLEPPPPPPPETVEEAPRPAPPLVTGDTVRLQPLPPELLASLTLPEPEQLPPARLDVLSTKVLQTVQIPVERLEDIPLRPLLTTQTEIRTTVLQSAPAAPALVKSGIPQPAAPAIPSSPLPPPPALLPGLPLAEPGTPPESAPVKPLLLLALPSGANAPLVPPPIPALQTPPLAGLPTPEAFTPAHTALVLPVSAAAQPITLTPQTVPLQPAPALSLQIASITLPEPVLIAKPGADGTPAPLPAFTPGPGEVSPILKQNARPDVLIAKVSGALKGPDLKGDVPVVKLEMGTPGPAAPGQIQPLFILHTPEPGAILPPGTELALVSPEGQRITAAPLIPTAGTIQTAPLPPYPLAALTPEGWPILDQIYQGLAAAAPQAAASLMNVTPNPGNPGQVMPAALFFIAAMRSGDLQGWLGDKALESLKTAGKSGLLSRLTQEGGVLSRLSNEPLSGDWRGMAFPMGWQNELHKIALYYKREERDAEESETANGTKGTRFIMDLTLTKIGRVQLDGYCRGKSFDLILRSP